MTAKKILFISQEITPYTPSTAIGQLCAQMPKKMHEDGRQVRVFMPRWGHINERRNQLHEVIRLSGMNIIIDDTDHTLIIKVASMPSARTQAYFIDNDDYFHKREMLQDESGNDYADNEERAIFFARGTLETVKKLRWVPNVIHCHGWISALAPIYIKTAYKDEPCYSDVKVVFSADSNLPQHPLSDSFISELSFKSLTVNEVAEFGFDYKDPNTLLDLALRYSDGFIQCEENVCNDLLEKAKALGKPVLAYTESDMQKEYGAFYDSLFD